MGKALSRRGGDDAQLLQLLQVVLAEGHAGDVVNPETWQV